MPAIGPIKRKDLIVCLRALGFEPPVSGGDHQYMTRKKASDPESSRRGHRARLAGAHPSAGRDRAGRMGSPLTLSPASEVVAANRKRRTIAREMYPARRSEQARRSAGRMGRADLLRRHRPAASPLMVAISRLHIWDKPQHFGAYLALSFLPVTGFRDIRRGIIAGLSMFVLGTLFEGGQHFSPGRAGAWT